MPYRLQRDESIVEGVRRIGWEQSDSAIERLTDVEDLAAAVHDVRKRCKKLRGLVRLVRPGMEGEYERANTAFRDAARRLAPLRDAHALAATFDEMLSVSPVDPDDFASVRAALSENVERANTRGDVSERIERATELIAGGTGRIHRWELDDSLAAVAAGVRKTYKRGRRRLGDSVDNGTVEDRHEWRKRVKYGWYHTRLLRNAAPSILRPLARSLHDVSDALGDDHDLAVLAAQIEADPARFGDDRTVAATLRLLVGWQSELQSRATSLGRRIYVESPKQHARRIACYVDVWMECGDESAAGEMSDIW